MADITEKLLEISTLPAEEDEFNEWLQFNDACAFLLANRDSEDFVVYASLQYAFIHAIAVPASSVSPPDTEDVMSWNCNPTSAWGMEIRYSEPASVWVSPPLHHTGSQTLDVGEQLVFARHFEGRLGPRKSYIEVLQRFVQISDLHYLPERSAYCRLDGHGDIEDIIRIIAVAERGEDFGGTIVTFNREVLDNYLALTDSAIVQTFDFTRYRPSRFGGWESGRERHVIDADLLWDWHIEPGYASYMRGCQVIRPQISKETLVKRSTTSPDAQKQYASFVAYDWKNKVVRELSCAPGSTANYFTESDLPFETTPAFFKPEVLLKYKADPDKYTVTERSITCRGAWHLQTYDINEAGQVHTYLVYLRSLPYEEQIYWLSYNERPKGTISKRAIKTDFKGEWDLEYNALESLKDELLRLNRDQVPWWTIRSKRLIERIQYPATASAEEWANELLLLDQLVIEGFETKWLRNKARELGRPIDQAMASLKLTEECLIGLGFADAETVLAPLKTVHNLRSKLKGHASGDEAFAIRKQVLEETGSSRNHFRALCEQCDESMRTIAGVLGERLNR